MIRKRLASLAVVLLALASTGCIALARETYTSLRGAGAEPLASGERVPVSNGRTGRAISQDPSLARVGAPGGTSVEVAVCDWDEGTWFIVFPPLPVPLLSPGELGAPGTKVVRVAFLGEGTWRAEFAKLALTGPDGTRVAPSRYKLVTRDLDRTREPCNREREPRTRVDRAEVAIFGDAELWLTFVEGNWPDGPLALELDGVTLDGKPVALPKLALEPGSRWFWYKVFP
jgi:hypothetical protein